MNRRMIKVLSTISILLFFLPFFQTCSDEALATKPDWLQKSGEATSDPTPSEAAMNAKLLEASKENFTVSGYDLALNYEDGLTPSSVFSLMMVLNFIIWINTLQNQFGGLLMVLFFNIVLLLFALCLCFCAAAHFGQIRYGMLLYTANTAALFCLVYKENAT